MGNKKKILICPLNWGLGHATRDVPIIEVLLKNNFEVIIAASEDSQVFLMSEFPKNEIINFPNYNVRYSKGKSQIIKMMLLFPKIVVCTIIEHIKLKKLISQKNIDIVISDNRFGLWNKHIYSIFITHQLKIKLPGCLKRIEFIYKTLLRFVVNKYDECWVPDFYESANLSGELSHFKNAPNNIKFIGSLSRFNSLKKQENNIKKFDILFILSGPEPQRTLFEEIIYYQTLNSKLKIAIIRGTNIKSLFKFSCTSYNLLNTDSLINLINISEKIICRSGYSTIMDLVALNKRAILVPTPGQTEQEYLAKYLQEKGLFVSVSQTEFTLLKVININISAPNFKLEIENDILSETIRKLNDK